MDLERKFIRHYGSYEVRSLSEDKQRRENWDELVTRNMNMHIKKLPQLEHEIRENYKYVFDKKVLLYEKYAVWESRSRSLQTAYLIVRSHLRTTTEYLARSCSCFSEELVRVFSSTSPR